MHRHAIGMGGLALLSTFLIGGCAISPIPLSSDEIALGTQDKLARVTRHQEPLSGPIDLPQAMARALKYNLDHKVEVYETALRQTDVTLAGANGLPSLVASSGYASRDKVSASSSYNLLTGTQNFGYSTSQDNHDKTSDLTFSWSVLDFGLSYVRAHQAADKVMIAEESRRKVVHRLMEDVRTAYWRAWSAQKLSSRLMTLERRTRSALARSSQIAGDRTTSPITALTYRRELIEIQRTLQEMQRELSIAKFQLAALMNVVPGTPFTLTAPQAMPASSAIAASPGELVTIALNNRPELRDAEYKKRINAREADAALLEMLPGIQLFAGPNSDSNSYLLNHNWLGWGAKASFNLLRVFQYPVKQELIDGQDKALDQRALALTMAVMTQVYVARARIVHFSREVEIAAAYSKTQQELLRTIQAEHDSNRVSEQTLLREELNASVGLVRLDIARISLETAKANLLSSAGLDPRADGLSPTSSVAEIANVLRRGGAVTASNSAPLTLAKLKE